MHISTFFHLHESHANTIAKLVTWHLFKRKIYKLDFSKTYFFCSFLRQTFLIGEGDEVPVHKIT